MDLIREKLQILIDWLTNKGIPLPLFRDLLTQKPSFSMTLATLSFVMWCLGITELIKDMDIDKCENMVLITVGLYLGRKLTNNNKDKTKLEIDTQQQGEKTSEQ